VFKPSTSASASFAAVVVSSSLLVSAWVVSSSISTGPDAAVSLFSSDAAGGVEGCSLSLSAFKTGVNIKSGLYWLRLCTSSYPIEYLFLNIVLKVFL